MPGRTEQKTPKRHLVEPWRNSRPSQRPFALVPEKQRQALSSVSLLQANTSELHALQKVLFVVAIGFLAICGRVLVANRSLSLPHPLAFVSDDVLCRRGV